MADDFFGDPAPREQELLDQSDPEALSREATRIWGAIFWIWDLTIGNPKRITMIYDIAYLCMFFFMGNWSLLIFFIVTLSISMPMELFVLNIFPMLDMPHIPWA
jgi:hypothetical protein